MELGGGCVERAAAMPAAADRSGDLGQQPFAEGADLGHVAARFGIDQPIGVAVVADQVEGLDQAAVGELGGKEGAASGSRRPGRPSRRCLRRPASPCCCPDASTVRRPATPAAANHCVHQRSPGSRIGQPQQVGGLLHAADAVGKLRAEHRREIGAKQHVHRQARPFAAARADADVDLLAREVDHVARRVEPHRDRGMRDLERAEMPGQPVGAEGLDGADDQRALRAGAHRGIGFARSGRTPR